MTSVLYATYTLLNINLHHISPFTTQHEWTQADFEPGYPQCTLGDGLEGVYSQTCVWRIPWTKMTPSSSFTVTITPLLKGGIAPPLVIVFSDNIDVYLSIPYVVLNESTYPYSGSRVSCQCNLISDESPPASASWYNQYNKTVGDYNSPTLTATLNISYSDPNQSYGCRPITPLNTQVTPVKYSPQLSSAKRNSVFLLHSLIIALGVVWTGVPAE